MSCDTGISRPIEAFVKYFLDVKPYHTKILEVLETYKFSDELEIELKELIRQHIAIINDPLCVGVGFGFDYDDECGFDADSCCDLFECSGGYGLIFDNSDLLVDLPIQNIDAISSTITVSGNRLNDTNIQVKRATANSLVFAGNRVGTFLPHNLFYMVPRHTVAITQTLANGFNISGNFQTLLQNKGEFRVINSVLNDSKYKVVSVAFDSATNTTRVVTHPRPTSTAVVGTVLISANTRNNTLYKKVGQSYNASADETVVTLHASTPVLFPNDTQFGSVILRTGLFSNRRILVQGNSSAWNNEEWGIVKVSYDAATDSTELEVEGQLEAGSGGNLQLRGYMHGHGFDGYQECTPPKPNNIHAAISEVLRIHITDYTGPDPSPTPTQTVSATPAASVTPTPSETPVASPTPTPTVTPTPSAVAPSECALENIDQRIDESETQARVTEYGVCRVTESTGA